MNVPLASTKPRNSRIFERHPENWYVEEAWCWDRLFDKLKFRPGLDLIDPCCGKGTVVDAALRAGLRAWGSDIVPRWAPDAPAGRYAVRDFRVALQQPHAIVASNPPFDHAEEIVEAALIAGAVVCMLLPATWAHGDAKGRWLQHTPMTNVFALTPRPKMEPGLGLLPGQKLGGGTKDFSIYVWSEGMVGGNDARFGWLRRDDLPDDLAALI